MRRIWLMMSMALMFAAAMALSGAAQAAPGDNKATAQCKAEAIRTLQPGLKLSDYHFVGGTVGDDYFDRAATAGPDVFCGFGGNDSITDLDAGDIFLGGNGNDTVLRNNGTFYGGAGDDYVYYNHGTFYGEAGNDYVLYPDDSTVTFVD